VRVCHDVSTQLDVGTQLEPEQCTPLDKHSIIAELGATCAGYLSPGATHEVLPHKTELCLDLDDIQLSNDPQRVLCITNDNIMIIIYVEHYLCRTLNRTTSAPRVQGIFLSNVHEVVLIPDSCA
jgi:hypothetical protein